MLSPTLFTIRLFGIRRFVNLYGKCTGVSHKGKIRFRNGQNIELTTGNAM